MKTTIIAEAGVNHNGDINLAYELIDAAAMAGADMVKFQTFCADRLVTPSAQKASYQSEDGGADQTQYAMLKQLELTREMHLQLIEHCRLRHIEFFSTGFDSESIDMLVNLGINRIKVPSGEVTNLPFLRHIGGLRKEVILSTGMSTLDEIGAALSVLENAGTLRSRVTVLHCNSEYPTPAADVNLRAMLTIRDAFGVSVGYSDHTLGIEVSIAATALGASIIEKHFTLDRRLPGPDHKASLEPAELCALVASVRSIEVALGDGIKRPSPSEVKNRAVARRSIVAARNIFAGEKFDESNLTAKRPGTGLSPMLWDEVLGKVAVRNFKKDDVIEL